MKFRLPITPAAALALVIIGASEAAFMATTEPLTGMPIFQPTVDDATLVAKRGLLRRASGQIVFIGDSSCLMGLDTDSFAALGLGHPVNLGSLLALTFSGFASLTNEALAQSPRAVVVAVLPRSFEVTEHQAREFDVLGRYLVAYHQNSAEYSVGLVDRWAWFVRKHRFNIYPPQWGGSFKAYEAALQQMGGHYVERGTYSGASQSAFRATFTPTEYSRRGFLQLAQVSRRHGVPIVLWWSPSPRDAVSPSYLDDASRFVEGLKADIPDLRIARPAPAWDPRMFGSVTHLTPKAAVINSQQLATYLAQTLSAGPSVELGTADR